MRSRSRRSSRLPGLKRRTREVPERGRGKTHRQRLNARDHQSRKRRERRRRKKRVNAFEVRRRSNPNLNVERRGLKIFDIIQTKPRGICRRNRPREHSAPTKTTNLRAQRFDAIDATHLLHVPLTALRTKANKKHTLSSSARDSRRNER